MQRGDVYKIKILLPNRAVGSGSAELDKYVLLLQGGQNFAAATDVAILIASTLRRGGPARPFEVYVGSADGFPHDTVIDARWPYTLRKSNIVGGEYQFRLSAERMYQVNVALIRGLQMSGPPATTDPA